MDCQCLPTTIRQAQIHSERGAKIFIERGVFSSNDKKWRVNLAEKVIGGEITVTVKVGAKLFRRKAFILANGPTREKIFKQLDSYEKEYESNARLAKLIFKQESNYRQFYSDGMPLVSFDKGYGLGQATTPAPTYEHTWNWRLHIDYIIKTVLPEKRSFAKHYLKAHPYTDENLDMETLVHYNGANYHYYVWSEQDKKWVVNDKVLCDPLESNKGWDVTSKGNENKTLEDLRSGKGEKPKYTGRCYAEHIKSKM